MSKQRPVFALFRSGAVVLFLLASALPVAAGETSPLSPEEALASFETEPLLRVELVASEPDVLDPVAMAFDARGRLFVVEARGYPVDLGRGAIALLEDQDGDGRYSRSSTFAEGLRFPTGVLPWKDGLFVTDSPEVLYLEDEDRDGKADARKIVLTGFATDRSTQLRVNDPTLGLDGYVSLAGGLSGGHVVSPIHPELPAAELRRSDIRFDPFSGTYASIDGKSQFGHAFDDYGRRFICMNRVQAQHVVISSRYLARNPRLAFSETVEDLPEDRVEDLLKGHNAAARIYPISDNITTADSHAGTFSAACAVTFWRGGALPERYLGQVFSCDPTGNLVHRDELLTDGATYRARRSPEPIEFLRSPDNWFRPVFLAAGPDGGLYLCDMYRGVIEHPDYLPKEIRGRVDFESGRDRGRIYRVVAAGASRVASPLPESPTSAELAEALESDLAWRRDTAFRLLLERGDPASAPPLERALSDERCPPGQVMAAHLLERLGALARSHIRSLLESGEAGAREVGIQLATPRLRDDGELARSVIALATDPDPRVRFACALALGELEPTKTTDAALAEIAWRGADDRWTRAAVISSASEREGALIDHVVARTSSAPAPAAESPGRLALLYELARAAGARRPVENVRASIHVFLYESRDDQVWPFALLNGLARAGHEPRTLLHEQRGLREIDQIRLNQLSNRALRIAPDVEAPLSARLLATEFLGYHAPAGASEVLVGLIGGPGSRDLQLAAVRSLKRREDGAALLANSLERWPSWTAAVREVALAEFLPDVRFARAFLTGVERGSVAATALSVEARKRLLQHTEETVRQRAEALFTEAERDRMKVLAEFRPAITLRGDPEKGHAVFRELCAPCHRLEREGTALGPDLFGVRNQTRETLLLHIIVPNREVASGFEATVVVTDRGEALSGMVTSETATSVTLIEKGGVERTLLRDEIVSMTVSSISLMPEGLEASTTVQGMADLLAYLRGEG